LPTLSETIQIDLNPAQRLTSTNQAQKTTESQNDSCFLSLSSGSREKKKPSVSNHEKNTQKLNRQNEDQMDFHSLSKISQNGTKGIYLMKKSART
jgi:hypothetical protein